MKKANYRSKILQTPRGGIAVYPHLTQPDYQYEKLGIYSTAKSHLVARYR
jgi:hypothetical protein